ncbi:MAG: DNA polymerase III subunit delta [Firmicutes bacterium]|nr:DNA polymerase III subunit delta [Bacillota bacterium]
MTYRRYFGELRQGNIAPVYLLFGEEDYLMDEVINVIAEQVLGTGERGFNYDHLDGEESELDDIQSAIETLPFGSPRRLVVVKNCPYFRSGKTKKGQRERLVGLLETLPATTCIVFRTRGKVDGRQKAVKLINRKGRLWEFPRLKGRDLASWITKCLRREGAQIHRETAFYLAGIWLYGLHRLEGELKKLASYVGEKGRVEREHIQLLVDPGIKENVFHLLDAVGKRRTRRALALLNQMLIAGEPPLLLLFLLSQRLRIIGAAKALAAENASPRVIASRLKQHPFVIEKALEQGRQFNYDTIRACLRECLWADRQLKGGSLEPRLVLELLLLKITAGEGV